MDLTMLGAGFIVGHLIARGFRKEDRYKVPDIIMVCIGLFLVIGSRYHFFGW